MTPGAAVSMIISGLLGSASGITHELTASDSLLRSPLALCRRIGFVQLRGGSGASSTAGYVASMLAAGVPEWCSRSMPLQARRTCSGTPD